MGCPFSIWGLLAFDAGGGTVLACNDDYYDGSGYPCGVQSRLDHFLAQGEQVLLQLSGFLGWTGNSTLFVSTICGPRQPAPFTIELIPTETDDSDMTISFDVVFAAVTEDINGNPLVVDEYRLYWTNQWAWDTFPDAWNFGLSSVNPGFSFGWSTFDPQGYFIVTAVDEDGNIIASSRPGLIQQATGALRSTPPALLPGAPVNGSALSR